VCGLYRNQREERELEALLARAAVFHRGKSLARWFSLLRQRIRVNKRVNGFAQFKRLRSMRFLKLLSFLYLKQECAMNKHIRHLQASRLCTLREKAFRQLQRNAYASKQATLFSEKREQQLKYSSFELLRVNVEE
jgi:hypothetical protein